MLSARTCLFIEFLATEKYRRIKSVVSELESYLRLSSRGLTWWLGVKHDPYLIKLLLFQMKAQEHTKRCVFSAVLLWLLALD